MRTTSMQELQLFFRMPRLVILISVALLSLKLVIHDGAAICRVALLSLHQIETLLFILCAVTRMDDFPFKRISWHLARRVVHLAW
jgi:hypothetical protein